MVSQVALGPPPHLHYMAFGNVILRTLLKFYLLMIPSHSCSPISLKNAQQNYWLSDECGQAQTHPNELRLECLQNRCIHLKYFQNTCSLKAFSDEVEWIRKMSFGDEGYSVLPSFLRMLCHPCSHSK